MKTRTYSIGALLVLVLALFLRPVTSQEERPTSALETRVDHTVREAGVVESAQTVRIANESSEEMIVLSVVPQGTTVKKGDLLVAFDDSKLQEQQDQSRLEIALAQAALEQAATQLAAAQKLAEQLAALNQSKVKVAELDQARSLSTGGQLEVALRDAKRDASMAEARHLVIKKQMERRKLQETAAVEDLETLELEAKLAGEEAKKAQDQIQLLTTFERPYQTALLELAVSQAKADLLLQQTESESAIHQAESQAESARLELEKAQAKLKQVEDRLAKCRIVAPTGGMVIYNIVNRRAASDEELDVGTKVSAGQSLLSITDVSQLRIRARVHESRIARVKKGQKVKIELDAFPNQSFQGQVLSVNQTPELVGYLETGGKDYAVLVSIDVPPGQLKLGLSAMVEIDTP